MADSVFRQFSQSNPCPVGPASAALQASMSLLEAIVLGLVQGLTEFLPISSTAHLRVVPELFGWPDPGAVYSAIIQLGTVLAVILYFWRDVVRMLKAFFVSLSHKAPFETLESKLAWYVLI